MFRVVGNSYILYLWPTYYPQLVAGSGASGHGTMLAVTLAVWGLNMYWFYLISQGVVRALTRGKDASDAKKRD